MKCCHPLANCKKSGIKLPYQFIEHFDLCNSLQYLNTNTTLYNAILKAEGESVLLTEETQRAATTLRIDFEKGGIHLPKGCATEIHVSFSLLITFDC